MSVFSIVSGWSASLRCNPGERLLQDVGALVQVRRGRLPMPFPGARDEGSEVVAICRCRARARIAQAISRGDPVEACC